MKSVLRRFKTSPHAALIAAALIAGPAQGDSLHYNNALIGDRATGMGGAYTAISDDPSGLFYNPAGIVYAGKRNFSASVNAYNSTTTTYKGVLGGGDWVRESSNLLPNFFGITQPIGKGTIGFSYAVTDSIQENQDSVFGALPGTNVSKFLINVNASDNIYKIGPSYALELSDTLAIGATLYFHIRSAETIANQWVRLNDNTYEWSNSYRQVDQYGLNPILGVMWSPMEKLSLGLSLRKTELFSSEIKYQESCVSDIATTSAQCAGPLDPVLLSSDTEPDLPLSTTIGFAVFPSNRLLISGDFSYYEATDQAEETWNLAAGAEYYLNDTWAVRTGMFTNNANTPTVKSGGTGQLDHVDLTGLSFSLSRFTRNSAISGGFSYSFGSGDAQVISGISNIQEVEVNALTLYLSSSYNY